MMAGTSPFLSPLFGVVTLVSTAWAGPDLARLDVCTGLPGAEVARAAGGRLLEAKPFQAPDGSLARCSYRVAPQGASDEKGIVWVVELLPAGQYETIRAFIEQSVRELAGIGDGAFAYKENESGRSRLYVRRRKKATLSLTGPDEAVLRRVALLALSRL